MRAQKEKERASPRFEVRLDVLLAAKISHFEIEATARLKQSLSYL
jgi:hypothetical protein